MATTTIPLASRAVPRPMSPEEKKVIFASSLGTVFEWYDFYLYGSLAAIIAKQFFSGLDAGAAFIFALLAFAAGFLVRPFGALVFGRLGDMIGEEVQRELHRREDHEEQDGREEDELDRGHAGIAAGGGGLHPSAYPAAYAHRHPR